MRILLPLLLLCLLPAPPACAQKRSKKHPIIVEFLRFASSKDMFVRRDQVERLAKVQTAESVDLIVRHGLTDKEDVVRERASWALGQMKSEEARAAVLAALQHSRPVVRRGAALGLGHSKDAAWASAPLVAALGDRSARVREAAAQALGMLEARAAAGPLQAALGEKDYAALIAIVDALALLAPAGAAEPLEGLLNHPNWRIQVAVLNALGRIRARSSIEPLIAYMRAAEGRTRQDARRALVRITTRTFGMNVKTWEDWWQRTRGTPWKVPALKEAGGSGAPVADEDPGRGYGRKPTRYHRMTTYSTRLLFVIDISASMLDPVLVKRGRDTGSRDIRDVASPKIDIAREELAFALRGLDKTARFNVIAFETDIRVWKKSAQKASASSVQNAIRWVERQKPRVEIRTGGMRTSRDSSGRLMGRTNTYGALRTVYGLPAEGRGGVSGGGRKRKPLWDTVFFLTDGDPTEGEFVKTEDILSEVRRWNAIYRLRINCIGMNATATMRNLLDGLARITGGRTTYLGK